MPAPFRPAEGKAQKEREHQQEDRGIGDKDDAADPRKEGTDRRVGPHPLGKPQKPAARRAAAERHELGVIMAEIVDHLIARQHHRQAARQRHHAERDHEGRHADIGDEDAVGEAADQRRPKPERNGKPHRIFPRHHHAGDHSRQAQHRSDREIDPAGDDDRSHAERDNADKSAVARDIEQVLTGVEGRVARRQVTRTPRNRRANHPERLLDRAGRPAVARRLNRFLERNCHVSNLGLDRRSSGWMAPVISPVTSSVRRTVTFLSSNLRPRRSTVMPVGHREHVGHAMADEDHGRCPCRAAADQIEDLRTWRTLIAAVARPSARSWDRRAGCARSPPPGAVRPTSA
jgi:hypothetical protein